MLVEKFVEIEWEIIEQIGVATVMKTYSLGAEYESGPGQWLS